MLKKLELFYDDLLKSRCSNDNFIKLFLYNRLFQKIKVLRPEMENDDTDLFVGPDNRPMVFMMSALGPERQKVSSKVFDPQWF